MTAGWFGRGFAGGMAVAVVVTASMNTAEAHTRSHQHFSRTSSALHQGYARAHSRYAHARYSSYYGGGLQCVPFARENSGIELSGNAGTWWGNAEGLYERGARPEVGSVLNFRSTSHMRLGHVAVVTNVLDSRHIEVDHANWGAAGRISRNIDVVDVSPENNWTAVRVALGESDNFGSVYPTYGFIYDRPDHGVMVANTGITATPALNPAPADYRSASERMDTTLASTGPEEVAEADDDDVGPRIGRRHAHVARIHYVRHHRGLVLRQSSYHGSAWPTHRTRRHF